MAGIADLLYLGAPNPAQQLAAMLSGQQAPQPPGGQGAAPPNGPAPGPAAGAAPTQPAAPGAPPPPGSPPQPQALASTPDMSASYAQLARPPDLMSLYLQLQQRQSASDQINRGLALIAANHSGSPAMARAIMESASGGGQDAGGMVNNLMSLYQAQQGMAAQQQLLAQAPAIAQKLGMDEGIVRSTILAGRGNELVQALEPTPAVRDIQAKHDMFIKNAVAQGQDPQAAEATWQRDYYPFLMGGQGGGDATTQSWRTNQIMWNRDHPGEPYPWGDNTPLAFGEWEKGQNILKTDQAESLDRRTTYVGNLTNLRNGIGNLIGLKPGDSIRYNDDGSLDTSNLDPAKVAALKGALSANLAQTYLSGDPKDLTMQKLTDPFISPDQKKILDDIRSITDPKKIYGSLTARPPKRAQSDVTQLGGGLSGMTEIRNKTPDDWLNGAVGTIKTTDTAIGNAFGASGEPEKAPDYTKEYIDPSYLQGGSMYPFGKKAAPMSSDQVNAATNEIKQAADKEGTRQKLIHLYLANNIDPTPLKSLRF